MVNETVNFAQFSVIDKVFAAFDERWLSNAYLPLFNSTAFSFALLKQCVSKNVDFNYCCRKQKHKLIAVQIAKITNLATPKSLTAYLCYICSKISTDDILNDVQYLRLEPSFLGTVFQKGG